MRLERFIGRVVGCGIVVVLVVGLLVWWRGGSGSDGTNGAGPTSSGAAVLQQYEPDERERPDDFAARLLDGTTFDSDIFRGRVAVYNVWGSWCGPCRVEAPHLARVAREFSEGVSFVGINVRDNAGAAQAFERAFEVPYPSTHPDDSDQALLAFGGILASSAVPSTVVLDAEGRVAARVVGPVDYATLRGLVEDAGAVADR